MCGIAGIVGVEIDNQKLKNIKLSLSRRGPDDSGYWISNCKNVGLVQTRLSIIDLSNSGHQPMTTADGRYTIVFNGEIYNFKEIRKDLEKSGIGFSTNSDTEVILNAWQKEGKESITRFRGMFAFAIWDNFSNQLTLVRDRMGIKPLYWSFLNGILIFGSTVESILTSKYVDPVLNSEGFFDYLRHGSIKQPKTIINGINSLMPGHYLEYSSHNYSIYKYWELEKDVNLTKELEAISFEEQTKILKEKMEDSINLHLISDVPVSSFLSGGIDSTIITALTMRASNKSVKSFSVGFSDGLDYKNELQDAKFIANYLGTEHHEINLSGEQVRDNFEDFISVIDQPSVDGLNSYWVSRFTKNNDSKVAISGLGADEIFAGYPHFSWPSLKKGNPFMNKLGRIVYDAFPNNYLVNTYYSSFSDKEKLLMLRERFSYSLINNSISKEILDGLSFGLLNENEFVNTDADDLTLYKLSLYESKNYLLNTLLRDADAITMGNSIEVRPVFLDHLLVQFALSLPDKVKYNNNVGKYILKEAYKDIIPDKILNRKKTGFTLPISRWSQTALAEIFDDILDDDYSLLFFNSIFLKKLKNKSLNKHYSWMKYMVCVFLLYAKRNQIKLPNTNYKC